MLRGGAIPSMSLLDFDALITQAAAAGASDLHLIPNKVPIIRRNDGTMLPLDEESLDSFNIYKYAQYFFKSTSPEDLDRVGDIDLSYTSSTNIRLRVNVFKSMDGINMAIRLFGKEIPSMATLKLPLSVQLLTNRTQGLILFSAPTGNGKTTSIASIIQNINISQGKRIITIEDPVEYIYHDGESVISQREIGRHCQSFASGLHAALRENPDIIVIGEMRDADTILTALSAAESGHLVFSTLHSGSVVEAIDRITQYFPASQHGILLAQLANSFEAIVCQKLYRRRDGQGRTAAFEVLLSTPATRSLIRENRASDLPGYMFAKDGMISMEASVRELKERGVI